MKPILLIGPICKDTNQYKNKTYNGIGGAVYYQTKVLEKLNIPYQAQVTLSKNDTNLLEYLDKNKTQTIFKKETIEFNNIYTENIRKQFSNFTNTPIYYEDLNLNKEYSAIILNPLLKTDFPKETIKKLTKHGKIYLSIQGLLRAQKNNNEVQLENNENLEEIFKHINTLFLDKNEAKIISKETKIENIIKTISPNLNEIIITLEDKGSLIYNKNLEKLIKISPTKIDKVNYPTGAGDTYMISYITKRLQGASIIESGNFASKIASYKIEKGL